jgi:DNA uptake protein ComE-like DNA-binding protein
MESNQHSENQKESAGPQKKQVANKASGQSLQEEIVNSNSMDDMFVTFTMVQQIMTGLSSAASEKEKVSINTKSVFSLLKRNGG